MTMIILLVCLLAGMGLGGIVQRQKRCVKFIDQFIQITVAVLLFILGVSIGENRAIIDNLTSLGLDAVLLTVGAVLGSILAVCPVYVLFFKGRQ